MAKPISSTNDSIAYGSINESVASNPTETDKHPILVLIREIRSGKRNLLPVLLCSLIAVIGACLNGFMLGFTSVLELNMENNAFPPVSTNTLQYIGSISTLGAFCAGIVAGYISDRVGRKIGLLLACVPYSFGFLLIALSYIMIHKSTTFQESSFSGPNKYYLIFMLIGRLLSGFGVGAFSLVVPVYIIEIAPSSLKGLFGSLNQLAVTIGILIIYILNTFVPYYISALVATGTTLVFALGVLFIPESPRWLVSNNEELDASRSLRILRGKKANIQPEMRNLKKIVESTSEVTFLQKLAMFRRRSVFIPMIFSIALMFFQQFCGINIVIFYAGSVLKSADVKNPDLSADFGVGVIQVVATFVGVVFVDLAGRKILLSVGGMLLAISTGVLGVYFFLHDHMCGGVTSNEHMYCEASFGYLAVVCLGVFIVGFSIGWGPIPWVMMTELAPLQVRGIMSGVATALNWAMAGIITSAFGSYEGLVKTYGAWWTFCVVSILSVVFTIVFLPETKGKDLEEIEEYFNRRYGSDTKHIINDE